MLVRNVRFSSSNTNYYDTHNRWGGTRANKCKLTHDVTFTEKVRSSLAYLGGKNNWARKHNKILEQVINRALQMHRPLMVSRTTRYTNPAVMKRETKIIGIYVFY